MRIGLLILLVWGCGIVHAQPNADPVLYAFNGKSLFDGKYGRVAVFQAALKAALARCRRPVQELAADGRIGPATARAVQTVANCPAFSGQIPADSAARNGAITQKLWRALLPNAPLPTVEQRAQTLVLTYEATDYDALEWNFCQSRPLWTPEDPTKPCYTNDPRSYITWGPRGATAGHGREAQWILWRVEQRDKRIVTRAFGVEAASARRLLTLNEDSARRLLCSVFADTARRAVWTQAFAALGQVALVREQYDLHYLSAAGDGAKMARFYKLWELLGLRPTATDYGFFLDRATHSNAPAPDTAATQLRAKLTAQGWPLDAPHARRAFAAVFPTANQTQDRLGRDVAFFIDYFGETGLAGAEREAWTRRGRLRASDAGLFEDIAAPPLPTVPSGAGPAMNQVMNPLPVCPASALNPQRPR